MKTKIIILINLICVLLTGCGKEMSQPESSVGVEQLADYTLLIYICGSDLESNYGIATQNIEEMMSAEIAANTNVLIQTGGAAYWHDKSISATTTDRYLITSGNKELVDRIPKLQNFGEASTLTDFIEYGLTKYPAKKTSLILWDHGGGSLGGVCYDSNFNNDSLSLAELEEAFGVAKKYDTTFEFIGFDACLMATYDVAGFVSNYAKYMIASEEIEPVQGWDYKSLIDSLGKKDFYQSVIETYGEKNKEKDTYTLSVIELAKLSQIEKVVEKIAECASNNISLFSDSIENGKVFGSSKKNTCGARYYDLGIMAASMGISYDWSDCIIAYNGNRHKTATGISLFIPVEASNVLADYEEICKDINYITFLETFFEKKPTKYVKYMDLGSNRNGKITFSVTESSLDYIRYLGFELCDTEQILESSTMYMYGESNDIIENHNEFVVDFNGEWVHINDLVLQTEIIEENESQTVYASPVKINDKKGELILIYDNLNHSFSVDGYILNSDGISRMYDLKAGDRITILLKLFGEKNETYIERGSIVWDENNTKTEMKKIKESVYQIIPKIIDIYGTVYYGSTFNVEYSKEEIKVLTITSG